MEYAPILGGLALGALLTAAGVALAAFYTPYTYSVLDTAATVVTGATLQSGNLLVVASVTAVAFDVLAALGTTYPLVVPLVVGYAAFHLVFYRSSIAITRLQARPVDPDLALAETPLGALPDLSRSVLASVDRRRNGN